MQIFHNAKTIIIRCWHSALTSGHLKALKNLREVKTWEREKVGAMKLWSADGEIAL